MLQQMVAVAELEAGMISARTRAALAAAKKRGKKLGGKRGVKPTAKMRALYGRPTGAGGRQGGRIGPTIKSLQAAGKASLRAIADGLNEQKIPMARGQGTWSAVQVARVLERLWRRPRGGSKAAISSDRLLMHPPEPRYRFAERSRPAIR